jgi:ribose transport system substrate-binding protein
MVSGPEDSASSAPRVRGFRDAARAFPEIRLAGPCVGFFDRAKAREAVAAWRGRFDAILAANDAMALGALDAGRNAIAAGVNAIPEAIKAIQDGRMLATADFDAMSLAALATECAIRHLRGEQVPQRIDLPVQVVDRANCNRWDLPFEQRPLRTLEDVT